jgi:predicted PurR-regulated permease PerM
VRVHPAIVLVVICIGAALFGIGGVFAAVPVGAAIGAVVPALIQALGTRSDARPIAGLVPVWLDRLGQWSWRALVVLALAIVVLRLIVVPIFSAPVVIAIVIACAMKPSADRLRARGFSPTRAALALTLGTALVITAVLVITLVSVVGELSPIVAQASIGASALGIGEVPVELVGAIGATLIPTGLALLRDAATAGVVVVAAALLTFFFLRDGAGWWARLLARVPADRRTVLGSAGSRAAQVLNGSTIGTGVVALFGAAAQWLTMTVLGLPLAFPIAVLTFFGGFIPYIGTFITTGLGFLVAVAAGDPIDVAVMAVFTLVLNIVQGNFVAPLVYGRTVHLHPAVVLLAAPIGAAFGGIVGMIVVVPIFGIVAATWRSVLYLFDPGDERRAALDVPHRIGDASQAIDELSVATARKEAAAGP